ncbi:hypothetical protein [Vibrio metschnikovii]|uniref:hypothetical protein n=1 Tax=Vibrio metschnikovii TaxID=28172 RepID=UPI00164BDEC7|nr:hypothetical protein [Vibrio metschnikovii]MBC5833130.1 hypothetical protein [Vibrio metschnikovii]
MDIAIITAGLSSIKTAIDIGREVQNASSSLEEAQIKLKLADLMVNLAEAKLQFIEAQDQILALKRQVEELEHKKSLAALVTRDGNLLLPKDTEIEPYGKGPWCTSCFETQDKLITLHHKFSSGVMVGSLASSSYKWECPACKNSFSAPQPDKL